MNHDPSTERQLIQRILAGETKALEQFYEKNARALYAYIFHACEGVKEDAEDIWQDTLLAAIHGLNTFHNQSRLFTWMCAIARRKIADHYRKLGSSIEATNIDMEDNLSVLIDHAPLPEAWIQEKTTRMQVVTTLQTLPDKYRHALVARYANEKSVVEISRMLGKTYKATESLLSRARSAFRAAFNKIVGDTIDGQSK